MRGILTHAALGGMLMTTAIVAPRPAFAAPINTATSVVSLTPASLPQYVSADVTLTAKVMMSATTGPNEPTTVPAPVGLKVEFSYNGTSVGEGTVGNGGLVTFTVNPSVRANTQVGANTLSVQVKGGQKNPNNDTYQASSAEATLTIAAPTPVPTLTTLALNPTSVLFQFATPITLTATATGENGTALPSGLTVKFFVDDNVAEVGTATLDANGQAVLNLPGTTVAALSANPHVFKATVVEKLVVDDTAKTATRYLATQIPGMATLTVIADQTAPSTTATLKLTNGVGDPVKKNEWYNVPITVSLEATDASGVKEVRYQIDNGPIITVPGAAAEIPLSDDGVYVIRYGAVDAYDNAESLTDATAKTIQVKLDRTAPVIGSIDDVTEEATGPQGALVAFTAPSVEDGGSGADEATFNFTPAAGIYGLGTRTVVFSASDLAGNSATRSFRVTVVDTTPPVITVPTVPNVEATSPAGAVVTFAATANDVVDGDVSVSYSQGSGTVFPLGTTTVTVTATDSSGNTSAASFTVTVEDTIAPTLNPSIHPNRFLLNAPESGISANASDSGSGLASVVHDPLDTSTVGPKTMNFTATDNAGNSVSASVAYEVGYGMVPLYDQAKVHKAGSTIPVKVRLVDYASVNVSGAGITVHALGIQKIDSTVVGTPVDSGNANPDNNFRYDATLGGYIFNLSTKGLTTGSYKMSFTAGNDPKVHTVFFEIK